MATWAELRGYEAHDAAYKEAHEIALNDINEGIAEQLSAARAGLTGAVMAVADTCGVAPKVRSELESNVSERVEMLVTAIFDAAIQEFGKKDTAESRAKWAGQQAENQKREEIRQQQFKASFSPRIPTAALTQSRPIPYGTPIRRQRGRRG